MEHNNVVTNGNNIIDFNPPYNNDRCLGEDNDAKNTKYNTIFYDSVPPSNNNNHSNKTYDNVPPSNNDHSNKAYGNVPPFNNDNYDNVPPSNNGDYDNIPPFNNDGHSIKANEDNE